MYIGLHFPAFSSFISFCGLCCCCKVDLVSKSSIQMTMFRSLVIKNAVGRVLIKTSFRLLFNMAGKAFAGHKRQKKEARHEVTERQQFHTI